MKIKILKKKNQDYELDEDLFSHVKPNSQRKKPITSKQKKELEKSDKESRQRSALKRKKEDELYLGTKNLHKSILEMIEDEYKEMMDDELDEGRKKIPQCGVGNPIHRADGTFGEKSTSGGSWSIRNAEGSNCSHGQTKYNKGKRPFTKLKCGRADHKNPNIKAPYRCKDGSKVNENEENENTQEKDGWVRIRKSALDSLLKEVETELLTEPELIDEDTEPNQAHQYCNSKGYHNIKQWLQHTNALKRAEDGELLDEPKKTKTK